MFPPAWDLPFPTLWPYVGWDLVIIAGAMFLWALRPNRRRRDDLRCRCGYDMAGLGLTCPECGRAARDERELRRPPLRRRRWIAAALVVALVGAQVADQPQRFGEGWSRVIPTTLLPLAVRRDDHVVGLASLPSWRRALATAAYKRSMRTWQRAWVDMRSLGLDDEGVRAMFAGRRSWLVGEPGVIEWTNPPEPTSIDDTGRQLTFCLISRDPDQHRAVGVPRRPEFRSDAVRFLVPPQEVGERAERMEVVLSNRDNWVIGRWMIDLSTRVVGTLDEAVPPVDSPELRDAVLRAITVIKGPSPANEVRYRLRLDPEATGIGAVPLVVQVLVDGAIVDTIRDPVARFTLAGDVAESRVTLVISSDQDLAYANPQAKAYWSGTIETPLAELNRSERRQLRP